MKDFPIIPVNDRAIARRSLVHGFGINDAPYLVQPKIDGKQIHCPFYCRWMNMIKRCYSKSLKKTIPTYSECSVDDRWKRFTDFREWMKAQDWEGKQLDKDLLSPGNKIYGPDTCVFISAKLNTLLNDCGSSKGDYPTGVSLFKRDGRFKATISIDSGLVHLGLFSSPEQAEKAYLNAKYGEIIRHAMMPDTPINVRNALLDRAKL